MVEEGTSDGGPKGGEKEELGEGEWVSLNTLSLKKTKIWQDYSTSLELKRREEKRGWSFVCLGMKEMGDLYRSSGENMNGRPFNEGWQRIINLDLILTLGEIWWKDQDMTRLLHFTRTQEKRREERVVFRVSWNEGDGRWKMGDLYSSGGENMNERPFNKGWQRIMNLDLILTLGEM